MQEMCVGLVHGSGVNKSGSYSNHSLGGNLNCLILSMITSLVGEETCRMESERRSSTRVASGQEREKEGRNRGIKMDGSEFRTW